MTDLDTLARAATVELLERSVPDVRSRYADLRRTRTRRTAAKLVTVGAAVALALGGWQLAGPTERKVQPAPAPGLTRNGVLLALPAADIGPGAHWSSIIGTPPAHLPDDGAVFAEYQFTADGTEVVYADRQARIAAVGLATGLKRTLVDCPDDFCVAAVSPDASTVASINGNQIRLQSVGSGTRTSVSLTNVEATDAPAWSPDGRSLAFKGTRGVYVADLSTGAVRLVRPLASETSMAGPVSWSPDGNALAFFDTQPVQRHGRGDTAFTAVALDLSTGITTTLLDAGQCFCAGVVPPTLTWSPDGGSIAVAITKDAEQPWGVYLVRPDGTGLEQVASGSYAALAWQPLRG